MLSFDDIIRELELVGGTTPNRIIQYYEIGQRDPIFIKEPKKKVALPAPPVEWVESLVIKILKCVYYKKYAELLAQCARDWDLYIKAVDLFDSQPDKYSYLSTNNSYEKKMLDDFDYQLEIHRRQQCLTTSPGTPITTKSATLAH